MKSRIRRKRAVTQQLKRHRTLVAPLSRAAKRALAMTKTPCPECGKAVAFRRLTDHYLVSHRDKIEEGMVNG
jgi:hypothetical protein